MRNGSTRSSQASCANCRLAFGGSRPIRLETRSTCVSTGISGTPKQKSITIDAAKTGVTLVDAPAGSDKRPYVAIDGTAQVTTFTLTFTGTYTFHTVVITDTFTQSYSLKTVFSTDYLEMPVITNTLAVLSIIPANVGDTPPTQTMAAADASFSYSFKDLTDPLGNTPPAVKPVSYSTMTGADLTLA